MGIDLSESLLLSRDVALHERNIRNISLQSTLTHLQDQKRDSFNCLPSYLDHAPSSTYSRASTNDIRHIRPTIEHGERSRVQTVV